MVPLAFQGVSCLPSQRSSWASATRYFAQSTAIRDTTRGRGSHQHDLGGARIWVICSVDETYCFCIPQAMILRCRLERLVLNSEQVVMLLWPLAIALNRHWNAIGSHYSMARQWFLAIREHAGQLR